MSHDPSVDEKPGPTLTQLDLHGRVTREPWTLGYEPRNLLAEAADTVILLGTVMLSTVLLFTFWRRDPASNVLSLPGDVALADPLRRGLAGLIDVSPGLLVATLGYGLSLAEVYQRWPGRGLGATFGLMLPGLVAVAVIVGHTTLLELLTGRSLGKWLTGLRVTDLTGQRPRPWQLLVRGLLKAFDLVAYLLLILPLISPLRQRLGDMVARTVVVMDRPDDGDGESSSGDDAAKPPPPVGDRE